MERVELNVLPSSSTATGFSKRSRTQSQSSLRFIDTPETGSDGSPDSQDGVIEEIKIKRGLKARHLAMISIGGSIGSGLLISSGTPLQEAGPVNSLVAYVFMASIVYIIVQALGEMSTYIPVAGSYTVFCTRFLSRSLGAANGYLTFYNWAVTFAVELSVIPSIIQFWTDAVPVAAWVSIFLVAVVLVNLCSVKIYGETEFWIAGLKVLAIAGWLIFALCMVCGAGDDGAVGFRYWKNPGPVGDGAGLVSNINTDRFLGWLSSLINAAFTYQGCETVSIASGECANPEKTIPEAIKKVLFRIMFFYISCIFFIGLLVPYNSSSLNSDESYISSSPFVIAIISSGTPILPHIFNGVILVTIISAANSDVYLGSRVLYGLSEVGIAPKFFQKCSANGVPYISVLTTAIFGCLAYLSCSAGGTTAFNWLVNISTVAGLIAWAFISLCHIRFVNVLKHNGMTRDDLPFKGHLLGWGDYYASTCVIVITFIQGYDSFFNFTASKFFTAYISLILFFALWIGFAIYYKEKKLLIPIEEVDIESDRKRSETALWADENGEFEGKQSIWRRFWLSIL